METRQCCCHSEGHQHGGRTITETSVIEFSIETKTYYINPEFRHIDSSNSFSAGTIQVAKT